MPVYYQGTDESALQAFKASANYPAFQTEYQSAIDTVIQFYVQYETDQNMVMKWRSHLQILRNRVFDHNEGYEYQKALFKAKQHMEHIAAALTPPVDSPFEQYEINKRLLAIRVFAEGSLVCAPGTVDNMLITLQSIQAGNIVSVADNQAELIANEAILEYIREHKNSIKNWNQDWGNTVQRPGMEIHAVRAFKNALSREFSFRVQEDIFAQLLAIPEGFRADIVAALREKLGEDGITTVLANAYLEEIRNMMPLDGIITYEVANGIISSLQATYSQHITVYDVFTINEDTYEITGIKTELTGIKAGMVQAIIDLQGDSIGPGGIQWSQEHLKTQDGQQLWRSGDLFWQQDEAKEKALPSIRLLGTEYINRISPAQLVQIIKTAPPDMQTAQILQTVTPDRLLCAADVTDITTFFEKLDVDDIMRQAFAYASRHIDGFKKLTDRFDINPLLEAMNELSDRNELQSGQWRLPDELKALVIQHIDIIFYFSSSASIEEGQYFASQMEQFLYSLEPTPREMKQAILFAQANQDWFKKLVDQRGINPLTKVIIVTLEPRKLQELTPQDLDIVFYVPSHEDKRYFTGQVMAFFSTLIEEWEEDNWDLKQVVTFAKDNQGWLKQLAQQINFNPLLELINKKLSSLSSSELQALAPHFDIIFSYLSTEDKVSFATKVDNFLNKLVDGKSENLELLITSVRNNPHWFNNFTEQVGFNPLLQIAIHTLQPDALTALFPHFDILFHSPSTIVFPPSLTENRLFFTDQVLLFWGKLIGRNRGLVQAITFARDNLDWFKRLNEQLGFNPFIAHILSESSALSALHLDAMDPDILFGSNYQQFVQFFSALSAPTRSGTVELVISYAQRNSLWFKTFIDTGNENVVANILIERLSAGRLFTLTPDHIILYRLNDEQWNSFVSKMGAENITLMDYVAMHRAWFEQHPGSAMAQRILRTVSTAIHSESNEEIIRILQRTATDTDEGEPPTKRAKPHPSLSEMAPFEDKPVSDWGKPAVQQSAERDTTRFAAQVIIQLENESVVQESASRLAGKHSGISVLIQLDTQGNYRAFYINAEGEWVAGIPEKFAAEGPLRWQAVGHGRGGQDELNHQTLGGRSPEKLALNLNQLRQSFSVKYGIKLNPEHINLIGCSLAGVPDDSHSFAHLLADAAYKQGIHPTTMAAYTTRITVNGQGQKRLTDTGEKILLTRTADRWARTHRKGKFSHSGTDAPLGDSFSPAAIATIQRVFSLGVTGARSYLNQYAFDETGVHNSLEFAQYLEQWGSVPDWSIDLRKVSAYEIIQGISIPNKNQYLLDIYQYQFNSSGSHSAKAFAIHLEQYGTKPDWIENLPKKPTQANMVVQAAVQVGDRIASGFYGVVYECHDDDNFVIKKLKQIGYRPDNSGAYGSSEASSGGEISFSPGDEDARSVDQRLEIAREEVDAFTRYYGQGSATVILSNNDVYVKMMRVPGQRLSTVTSFPSDAVDKFWQMIEELDRKGIWHGDLHADNIMYDSEHNKFYPIDITDIAYKHRGFDHVIMANKAAEHATEQSIERLGKVEQLIKNRQQGNGASIHGDALSETILLGDRPLRYWDKPVVQQRTERETTRFDGQLIIQLENDPVVGEAAALLAAKHPGISLLIQLDTQGESRLFQINAAGKWKKIKSIPEKFTTEGVALRWQVVGHGRGGEAELNHQTLGGRTPQALAKQLSQLATDSGIKVSPEHISLVGCSLAGKGAKNSYIHQLMQGLTEQGIHPSSVAAYATGIAVNEQGQKRLTETGEKVILTRKEDQWITSSTPGKVNPVGSERRLLNSLNLAQDFEQGMGQLYRDQQLSVAEWLPWLQTLQKNISLPGRYSLQFIHKDSTKMSPRTRTVATDDSRITDFIREYDHQLAGVKEHFDFTDGQLVPRSEGNVPEAEGVHGLNTAFIIQTWFNERIRSATTEEPLPGNLRTALQVHTYASWAQMGWGAVDDGVRLVQLWKEMAGEGAVAGSLFKTFSHISTGAGVGLNGLFAGLDAYELAHAQNEAQRAVFGTQLAFDLASLSASTVSLGAGAVGAATVAGFAGALAVPLAGLGIGITALVQATQVHIEKTKAVGRYFADLDNGYQEGGYRRIQLKAADGTEHQMWQNSPGIAIRTLDLRNQQLTFGDTYIYKTHIAGIGSGYTNDVTMGFGSVKQEHRLKGVDKKDKRINIREGINHAKATVRFSPSPDIPLVLPGTPEYVIDYNYATFPFVTARHDRGFEVLRRLESNYRRSSDNFSFDFYCFPSEYAISELKFEFVSTPVQVLLDDSPRTIIMPSLSAEARGKMAYTLAGGNGTYHISLQEDATLTLTKGSSQTRWVLDARAPADAGKPHFDQHGQLQVGRMQITLSDIQGTLDLISQEGTFAVDVQKRQLTLLDVDAHRFNDWQSLHNHLKQTSNTDFHHQPVIPVDDYLTPEGERVGRAFYETARDRFIYTRQPGEAAFLSGAQLAKIDGDQAWFYLDASVWQVDIATGKVLQEYAAADCENSVTPLPLPSSSQIITGDDGHLYFIVGYQKNEKTIQYTWQLSGQAMTLTAIAGEEQDIPAINGLVRLSPGPFSKQPGWAVTVGEEVYRLGRHAGGNSHCWLKKRDGIQEYVPFLRMNFAAVSAEDIQPVPVTAGNKTSYYFYSSQQQKLYFQPDDGLSGQQAREVKTGIRSLLVVQGQLMAQSGEGMLWLAGPQGDLRLAGVTADWIREHRQDVITPLRELASTMAALPVLRLQGLHNSQGKTVMAWYDVAADRVIPGGAGIQVTHALHYLGLAAEGKAWLYDGENKQLYLQPAGRDTTLTLNEQGQTTVAVPPAERWSARQYSAALSYGDKLRLTTTEGAVLSLPKTAGAQDKPLLIAWQTGEQKQSATQLAEGVEALRGQVRMAPAIRWLSENTEQTPAWYLTEQKTFLRVDLNTAHDLRYLGQAAEQAGGYIHDQTTGNLWQVGASLSVAVGKYRFVSLRQGELVLQYALSDRVRDRILPQLKEANRLAITGQTGGSRYLLDAAVLSHYRQITIDERGEQPVIQLPEPGEAGLLVQRQGQDLLWYAPQSETQLRIMNAEQAAKRGMKFVVADAPALPAAQLLQKLAGLQAVSPAADWFRLAVKEGQYQLQGADPGQMMSQHREIIGTGGDDTYRLMKGDGKVVIEDIGGNDSLFFDGISYDQLLFSQKDNNLVIKIRNSEDSVTVQGVFSAPDNRVETITTSDHARLEVSQLLNAMRESQASETVVIIDRSPLVQGPAISGKFIPGSHTTKQADEPSVTKSDRDNQFYSLNSSPQVTGSYHQLYDGNYRAESGISRVIAGDNNILSLELAGIDVARVISKQRGDNLKSGVEKPNIVGADRTWHYSLGRLISAMSSFPDVDPFALSDVAGNNPLINRHGLAGAVRTD